MHARKAVSSGHVLRNMCQVASVRRVTWQNKRFLKKNPTHINSCQSVIYNHHLQNKQLCSCSCIHRTPTHINTTATRVNPAASNGMEAVQFFSLPFFFWSHSINHTLWLMHQSCNMKKRWESFLFLLFFFFLNPGLSEQPALWLSDRNMDAIAGKWALTVPRGLTTRRLAAPGPLIELRSTWTVLLVLPEAITMTQQGHRAQQVVCVEWRRIRGVFTYGYTGCIPPPTQHKKKHIQFFFLCFYKVGAQKWARRYITSGNVMLHYGQMSLILIWGRINTEVRV